MLPRHPADRVGCPPRPGTSACAEGMGGSRMEDIGKVSRRKDTGKLSRREKVAKLIGGGFVTIPRVKPGVDDSGYRC